MSIVMRLLLLAAAFTAVLAGMAGLHLHQRDAGAEVRLPTEPVDPRDLLLGHYVIIRTPVHELDTGALAGADEFERGDPIWVELGPGPDGYAEPIALRRTAPSGPSLQGRVRYSYTPFLTTDEREAGAQDPAPQISAAFNIERYYASPDDALELEMMRQDGRLAVILSVAADGAAVIKGLEIDGATYYDRVLD